MQKIPPPLSATAKLDFVFTRPRPVATNLSLGPDVSFRGEAEVGRAAESAASVENEPTATFDFAPTCRASTVSGRTP
jgi:hypothetical protein